MGIVGGLAARGEHHRRAWELLGVERPAATWDAEDFYPDALPCLAALRRARAARRCRGQHAHGRGGPAPRARRSRRLLGALGRREAGARVLRADRLRVRRRRPKRSPTSATESTTTSSPRSPRAWSPCTCAAAHGATCTTRRPPRCAIVARRAAGGARCLSSGSASASTPTRSRTASPLVLGGVAIEHPRGLAGHSDGDVIAHALTDAVLGAAGLGDIGALFPSGDARWHGADSLDLLRDAYAQVREAGYALVNADCVLIGEEPRIAGAPRGDARPPRRRARRRAGARQRPRDDDRPARLHRPRRRARGRGGRPAGAHVKLVSYAERPDLLDRRDELGAAWDEFMYHDAVANVTGTGSTRSSPTCSSSCSTTTTGCSPSRTPSRSRSGPASCPTTAGMRRSSRRSPAGPRRPCRRSRSRSASSSAARA